MFLFKKIPAYSFITFRIIWGMLLVYSTLRFMWLGWVKSHYLDTKFAFKYWGFSWVSTFDSPFLVYSLHIILILGAICLIFNIWYRLSTIIIFLAFTYIQLLDLTYYLNHYYFVSLVCFLMIFFPKPTLKNSENTPFISQWVIIALKIQIAIVYIYAGIAKINYDWLILALPLKIWLPAHDKLFLIGDIFRWQITPFVFSWCGMLYDCFIIFFLLWHKTRILAYIAVIVFHTLTGLLFQIGIFPLVMTSVTLIFFSDNFHKKLLNFTKKFLKVEGLNPTQTLPKGENFHSPPLWGGTRSGVSKNIFLACFYLYFAFQFLFPFRYLLYKGNLFWTERGYRFSWRVMLMEKAGTATFYIKNTQTGKEIIIENRDFLNAHQEKQMSMQPDMILQFAHFLGNYYEKKGVFAPQVRAEVYVTLNGRPSKLLIDPNIDLIKVNNDEFL